ncbi:MAG: lipopolysaccharide core heptose(I) kinase RfaP [Pseudomonadales bacterium]|nr:lipopolysaccharide core heptose(I) kinase RfaP [Pseudomonadales bacterium]
MFVSSELRDIASIDTLIDTMAATEGETYRQVPGRRTFRFEHGGKGYFAKIHFGVGWREIIKNYLQFRAPVVDASNEFRAIHRLQGLDIDTLTPVAYAARGKNPATRQSCLVTAELLNTISLEDLVRQGGISPVLKRALIAKVAWICKTMHRSGLNHRDLYICHFHLDLSSMSPLRLYVIDLHRAQLRDKTPRRWIVKDLGELLFSTAEAGLTKRDLLRFVRAYSDRSLRDALRYERRFWRDVRSRADRLDDREAANQAAMSRAGPGT